MAWRKEQHRHPHGTCSTQCGALAIWQSCASIHRWSSELQLILLERPECDLAVLRALMTVAASVVIEPSHGEE